MITLKVIGGRKVINSEIRRPAVYLDHCGLRAIASDCDLKKIFVAFMKTKGTLLFSLANIYDIVGQNPGKSLEDIKRLLSEIGPNWVLIKINPVEIMHEVGRIGTSSGKPYFDEDLLKTFVPRIKDGNLDLSKIMDLIDESRVSLRGSLDARVESYLRFIELARKEFKSRRAEMDAKHKRNAGEALKAGRFIEASYYSIMRLMLVENFNFDKNDAMDMLHAIVPLGLADVVILDTAWKGLADKDPETFGRVSVFCCKEPDVKRFFRVLYGQLSFMDKMSVRSSYRKVKNI